MNTRLEEERYRAIKEGWKRGALDTEEGDRSHVVQSLAGEN